MSDFYTAKLQDIAVVLVSNVDKKTYSGQKKVVLCNYMDVYSNDYITADLSFMESTASDQEISQFTLKKGDIVITKDSESPFDIGVPAVVVDDIPNLVCGYHLAIIRPNLTQVDPYYLAKQLSDDACVKYFGKVAAGSTRFGLSIGAIKETPIMLTGLPTQRKIGHISRNVDAQIVETETLVSKYQRVKQGIMTDLFSRGVDPATGLLRPSISEAPELYRDTPIGSLPKEWDVLPASLICERVIDCKNRTPPERDEGFAVVKTFNIKDGELVFDTLTFTDHLSFDIWTARGVPSPGDIVITREAPVGESFLIEEDMPQLCLGQRTMLYRPDSNVIESDFMYFATRSPRFQKRLLDMAGGSTVGHVRVGDVKDMLFPIPSSVEQKAIAKNCTAINMKLRVEKAMLDKLKAHKAGLMRDLLTGKVPVSA